MGATVPVTRTYLLMYVQVEAKSSKQQSKLKGAAARQTSAAVLIERAKQVRRLGAQAQRSAGAAKIQASRLQVCACVCDVILFAFFLSRPVILIRASRHTAMHSTCSL